MGDGDERPLAPRLTPIPPNDIFNSCVCVGPQVKKSPTDRGIPIKLDCARMISSTRSARKQAKSRQSKDRCKIETIQCMR